MKKLEEIIECLKGGSVFTIKKYFYSEDKSAYSSCITIYDGRIFKDVKTVEIRDFLLNIPNIKKLIDNGFTYQIKYDREKNVFENAIVTETTQDKYKEVSLYHTVNDLLAISSDFLDGIIELDTRIISTKEHKVSKRLVANL